MANCLKTDRKLAVLHHLVEGASIRSTERLTGVHRDTIMRLLLRTGRQCREFLDDRLRNLRLRHVQLDEIWTFVLIKQANIPMDRKGDPRIGDQYLFVAFDEDTKLIATYAGENVDPLPSFGDEPIDVQIQAQKPEELAEIVYRALAPRDPLKDFRVGVAAACYRPSTDRMNISIINSHVGDR